MTLMVTQSSRKRGDSRDVKQPLSFPVNEANRVDLYNALAQWRDGPVNDDPRAVLYNAVERGSYNWLIK